MVVFCVIDFDNRSYLFHTFATTFVRDICIGLGTVFESSEH